MIKPGNLTLNLRLRLDGEILKGKEESVSVAGILYERRNAAVMIIKEVQIPCGIGS